MVDEMAEPEKENLELIEPLGNEKLNKNLN
jgi:hypothetical protein